MTAESKRLFMFNNFNSKCINSLQITSSSKLVLPSTRFTNAIPSHGQNFVSVNANSTNMTTYPPIAPTPTPTPSANPGYAQLNTIALSQQMNSGSQLVHTIVPTQGDGTNVHNQVNVQTQQNASYAMPQMVLTGMISQQILTIPINQATQNQMVQLVSPNGQILTSTVANLQTMSTLHQGGPTVLPTNQQQLIHAANGQTYTQTAAGIVQASGPQLVTNSAGQVFAMAHPNIVQAQQALAAPTSSQVSKVGFKKINIVWCLIF
ncbi:hypothetical protein GQR58_022476 [Nymphon striatum]|nr:hypothetical protein GQR58_022476 [Nymphon striatum]